MHPTVEIRRHMGRAFDPTTTIVTLEVRVPIPEINQAFHHDISCGLGVGRLPDTTPETDLQKLLSSFQQAASKIELIVERLPDGLRGLFIHADGEAPKGPFFLDDVTRRTEVAISQETSLLMRRIAQPLLKEREAALG